MSKNDNPSTPVENLAIGKIIEVDGSHVVAELDAAITELSRVYAGQTYPIGQFGSIVKVHFGRRIIFAYVGRLRMKAEYERERGISSASTGDERVVEADLFGEGEWFLDTTAAPPLWTLRFERGVSTFPLPQQLLYLTPKRELQFIYGQGKGAVIEIGTHVGTGDTPCFAELNELIGKHTAILGATGAGKSGTVTSLIHAIVDRGRLKSYPIWKPRIIILDPHNEYGAAFPGHQRLSTDEGSLSLPYWFLDLQQTIALVIGKTEFVATSQSNIVKVALLKARKDGAGVTGIADNAVTVDSPTPYSLDKFKEHVEAQRPPGKDKKEQEPFNSVINKLETLQRDARMQFLMKPWDGAADPLADVMLQFVGDGPAVRIVDLSGVPNEVAGIATAVIARTLFNFKLWQKPDEREHEPVLLICEEAHRYVPNRGEAQYEAAQEAVRRLAKEGRKYGLGLFLVSQRPSEVEATVLSQCNSWIVHRITNDTDREHVRAILPDSLAGLTKILSGLRRREVIFVGQATMLPSRVLIRNLAEEQQPRSHDIDFDRAWQSPTLSRDALKDVGQRWRLQKR